MAASAFVIFLILGCMGSLFLVSLIGWRLGKRHEGDALGNLGAMRSVVFSIFGLLFAFAFNGVTASYENRQRAIREENETVQAAYNLLPGLPKKFREAIEPMFESYQDLRIQSYRVRDSYEGLEELNRMTDRVEDRIWSAALKASLDPATNELGPAFRL